MSTGRGGPAREEVHVRNVAEEWPIAAQVKFGARTGSAPVVLGLVKLVLGLLLGSSLAELFRAFPEPLLGSLLIFSGLRLPPHLMLRPHPSAGHDTGYYHHGRTGTWHKSQLLSCAAILHPCYVSACLKVSSCMAWLSTWRPWRVVVHWRRHRAGVQLYKGDNRQREGADVHHSRSGQRAGQPGIWRPRR